MDKNLYLPLKSIATLMELDIVLDQALATHMANLQWLQAMQHVACLMDMDPSDIAIETESEETTNLSYRGTTIATVYIVFLLPAPPSSLLASVDSLASVDYLKRRTAHLLSSEDTNSPMHDAHRATLALLENPTALFSLARYQDMARRLQTLQAKVANYQKTIQELNICIQRLNRLLSKQTITRK